MKVLVTERGETDAIITKSRVVAPKAVEYLSKLFEAETFADSAVIVIDWLGDMTWNGEGDMPQELRTPAMVVFTEKWYHDINSRLKVDLVLDLEEFFGADNASKDDLHEVVQILHDRVREEEAKRGITA